MSKVIIHTSLINELIEKKGWNKTEFVKRSGLSHGTFYNTMRDGECTPENVIRIARALNVSPTKLVPYVPEELRLTPLFYESVPSTSRTITPQEMGDLISRISLVIDQWAGENGITIGYPTGYDPGINEGGEEYGNG